MLFDFLFVYRKQHYIYCFIEVQVGQRSPRLETHRLANSCARDANTPLAARTPASAPACCRAGPVVTPRARSAGAGQPRGGWTPARPLARLTTLCCAGAQAVRGVGGELYASEHPAVGVDRLVQGAGRGALLCCGAGFSVRLQLTSPSVVQATHFLQYPESKELVAVGHSGNRIYARITPTQCCPASEQDQGKPLLLRSTVSSGQATRKTLQTHESCTTASAMS